MMCGRVPDDLWRPVGEVDDVVESDGFQPFHVEDIGVQLAPAYQQQSPLVRQGLVGLSPSRFFFMAGTNSAMRGSVASSSLLYTGRGRS